MESFLGRHIYLTHADFCCCDSTYQILFMFIIQAHTFFFLSDLKFASLLEASEIERNCYLGYLSYFILTYFQRNTIFCFAINFLPKRTMHRSSMWPSSFSIFWQGYVLLRITEQLVLCLRQSNFPWNWW